MNIFYQMAQENDSSAFSPSVSKPAEEEPESKKEENIFHQIARQKKLEKQNEFGFLETLRDVGEQALTKGVSGAAGSYGNLAETLGLQLKEGETTPGKEARNLRDIKTLEKLEKGEVPSAAELEMLSDQGELPEISRLPTSKEIERGIEKKTGIGEGKTPIGRITGKGAEFIGEGAATGGGLKALVGLALGGGGGQIVREAGGPESLANAIEVIGSLGPSFVSGKLQPSGKAAKDITESGRKIGLTESQITPLIQGEKKVATLSKTARKGSKTKELFSSIKEKLGDSYNNLKGRPEAKIKIPGNEQGNLKKQFEGIRESLSRTLAPSPEKQGAIDYIDTALRTIKDVDITPEYLVNFWQDINKSVKWNSISGGKKALSKLKEPISEILERSSPQLAKEFEMTNQLYSKYSQISKSLKPDIIDALINKGEILAAPAAGLAFVQGNPWVLAGLGTESAIRLLSREMLINPYFQNLGKKLVKNFNQGSTKAISQSVKSAQEYLSEKYPQEDWKFLTED